MTPVQTIAVMLIEVIIIGLVTMVIKLWGDCMNYESQLREERRRGVPTGDLESQARAWHDVWEILQENGMPEFQPTRNATTGAKQALEFVRHLIALAKIKGR